MLELPWLKVEKSVNRVEKNLLDVCATLQSQIDKMSCESDNDIDEVSNSISNIANDISTLMGDVSGIKSDIQMLKSGVLSNQEMICDLKRKFDNFSSTLGGGKEMDVTDSYSKVASSNSWLSKTSTLLSYRFVLRESCI